MKKIIQKILKNVRHKISFWSKHNFKETIFKYGVAFFVIVVIWEIVEDVLFPLIAFFLGQHVDPMFYSFVPVAWLVCLHPIAVPILWALWCIISRKKE